MPLTDIAIHKARPKNKVYKLADEKGLFLLVHPNGSKYWRYKYYLHGKEKGPLSLGIYPEVTLAEAREKRDKARRMAKEGINPGLAKKMFKHSALVAAKNNFEAIAREWFVKHFPSWDEDYSKRLLRGLEKDISPWLGNNLIKDITAPQLLTVLRRIEERGARETAHRMHQCCGRIFSYTIVTGRAERDPSNDLRSAIPPLIKKHLASIKEPKGIGELLRAIESHQGQFITKCALMKIMHIVPLSKQAISILKDVHAVTGHNKYVFPSILSPKRPMSANTVLGALRRLGYSKEEMTGHGFCSMASTILNEHGWNPDAIERQLAHIEQNKVQQVYITT